MRAAVPAIILTTKTHRGENLSCLCKTENALFLLFFVIFIALACLSCKIQLKNAGPLLGCSFYNSAQISLWSFPEFETLLLLMSALCLSKRTHPRTCIFELARVGKIISRVFGFIYLHRCHFKSV